MKRKIETSQPAKLKPGADKAGNTTKEQRMAEKSSDKLSEKLTEKLSEKLSEKPVNLRANVMPTEGFVLAIDGKLKGRYETAKEAMTAGTKLKQSYPVIQVAVYDAAQRAYTPIEAQETQEAK